MLANKHRGRNRYHGRGKAGRGAGKRSGRGNAGMNKYLRDDLNWHMPKLGACRLQPSTSLRTVHVTANVGQLEEMANGKDTVDLTSMGIDKLSAVAKSAPD